MSYVDACEEHDRQLEAHCWAEAHLEGREAELLLLEARLSGERTPRGLTVGPTERGYGMDLLDPCQGYREHLDPFVQEAAEEAEIRRLFADCGACPHCGYDANYCADHKVCESRWDAEEAEQLRADDGDAARTRREWAWLDKEHWLSGGSLS